MRCSKKFVWFGARVSVNTMEQMEVDAPEGEQQRIELSEKLKEEANKLFVGNICFFMKTLR